VKLIDVLGWAVPFIWAGVWAAITVPWVRSALHRERVSWEEESNIMTSTMNGVRGTETGNKQSEEPSTSGETAVEEANEKPTVEETKSEKATSDPAEGGAGVLAEPAANGNAQEEGRTAI
jgi:hypothetical protein